MSQNTKKKKFNIYDYFRDLEKFYGVLYMLLLGFIIYLGAKYVSTLDYNKLYSAPPLLLSDTSMRVELPIKRGALTPPVDVVRLSTPTPELVAHGKELYSTTCASCHGESGKGDGVAGATLNPPPRNFVDPSKQTWKNGSKVSNMYVTLQEGIPNTGMASFSNLTPEDRFAIIQYVQTFNPTYPKDNPEDLKNLDEKFLLSKGGKLPNQIPLALAMQLEVLDNDTLKADLNTLAYKIANDKSNEAVAIFKEIVSDESKALNSLSSNMKWNESAEEFISFAGTNPLGKGFKASVYQVSPEKMNLVYQYLKSLFEKSRV